MVRPTPKKPKKPKPPKAPGTNNGRRVGPPAAPRKGLGGRKVGPRSK